MSESIDNVYSLLILRRKEALKKRNEAIQHSDIDRSQYWLGYFDALQLVCNALKPFAPQETLDFEQGAQVPLAPRSQEPLAETENIRPSDDNPDSDDDGHCVTVSTEALTSALRRITRFRKKAGRGEMAIISFRDSLLTFSMLNASEGVPAEGLWSSDIIVSSHIIYNCAKVPPSDETVVIKVSDGRLYIGTAVTPIHLGR